MGWTAERINARAKREKAMAARTRGHTWAEVAKIAGYASAGRACTAVGEYLKQTPIQGTDELRQVESEKLDRYALEAMKVLERQHVTVQNGKVVGKFVGFVKDPDTGETYRNDDGKPIPVYEDLPDDAPVLQAIDRLVRIAERRAKLMGLDAPVRIKVEEEDGLDEEIEQLMSDIRANQVSPPAEHPG